eukprot:g21448.t1
MTSDVSRAGSSARVDAWLRAGVNADASDLHLAAHRPPLMRVHGKLRELAELPLDPDELSDLLLGICPDVARDRLDDVKHIDFSLTRAFEGTLRRFRANLFYSKGLLSACFRFVPTEIPDLNWAGFPEPVARKLASFRNGFVLLTGVAGSGKTTSLAMIINMINQRGGSRIITVEEPIEYLFPGADDSLITQREVGIDVKSFSDGLVSGLRQDPDVILVGEIRDRETARMALSAAETGHLVFSTLHSRDAKGAISRFTDLFPQTVQSEIRSQLSFSLRAVISQHLLPSVEPGQKRELALEILFNNIPIASGIRQGKIESLDNNILTGSGEGMRTLTESVQRLLDEGRISRETAAPRSATTFRNSTGNSCDTCAAGARAERLISQMTHHTRSSILETLRRKIDDGRPILGGGAGTGISAKLEEAGGIDLIVIYNSGRFRMAGRGSLAGMMPYGDANAIVMEMAAEVLPVVQQTPVLAGVCGTDPFRVIPRFLQQVRDAGFAGVQNFPTVGLIDGTFRVGLEETGMGFGLEVDMIRQARAFDLLTTPYAFNADEARAMAEAGADILIPHMGLTTKGAIGARSSLTLDEAAARVQEMHDAAKRINPEIIVLCHGGPIAEPADAQYILDHTEGVVGFYGASSMERLPVEPAITERIREFTELKFSRPRRHSPRIPAGSSHARFFPITIGLSRPTILQHEVPPMNRKLLMANTLGILTLISGAGAHAQKAERAPGLKAARTSAINWVDSNRKTILDVNKAIWEFAEVGLEEKKSSKLLMSKLKDAGFKIESGVAEMPTAFVASYGQGRPIIGILAEYDALPGMSQKVVGFREAAAAGRPGHACGHSGLGSGALGAALAVKHAMEKHKLKGTIRLYGTPAEETVIGKVYMLLGGQFRDLDVCLHWHPSSQNGTWSGSSKAIVSAKFTFNGTAAHAAGSPHSGRSALDAVELMNVGVNYMREHVKEDARFHYVITNGGGAPNVVPPEATVWYYVRADKHTDVEKYFKWISDIAKGAAMMTRTKMSVRIDTDCHELIPNSPLSELVYKNLKAVGAPKFTEEDKAFARRLQQPLIEQFGTRFPLAIDERIHSIAETSKPSKGSTDVGDISWYVPTGGVYGMKAAVIYETGSPDVIQFTDIAQPQPGPTEVLVKVGAAALNPIDTYIRSGAVALPIEFPYIIGCDLAGTVTACGEEVSRFQPGDRVWGSNQSLFGRKGTFAEFACVDECWLYPTPSDQSDAEAAAGALVGITAHLGLFLHAELQGGEVLFVNGGSGGVGSSVIQLGKSVGAKIVTTAGSDEKLETCRNLGADCALDYHSPNLDDDIRAFVEPLGGINVWFETLRSPTLDRTVPMMAKRGRIVLMAGREARPEFPVGPFYVNDLRMVGFAMFNASPEEQREAATSLNVLYENGDWRPNIAKTFPLSEAAAAHQLQEDNTLGGAGTLAGKIIVEP